MIAKIRKIFLAFSKIERVVFVVASVLLVISGWILGNILLQKITQTVAARGGDYAEGMIGQPSYVNPVIAANDADKSLVRMMFSNATDISEKIETENEGRVWSVRIKEHVRWHDKEELTSDDVVFTVQKIQDPDSRSPLFKSWQGVRVERVSEREVRFNLGAPYAFFEENLNDLYILPKHLFENIPVSNWRISEFNLKPVGSGPYQFDSYEKKSDGFITTYRVKPSENYFKERAFISSFSFQFFSKKEDLLHAFNAGRIDGFAGIEVENLPGIKRPYEASYFNLPNYYAIFFNQNQNIALKELPVRKALARAVPRSELIAEVFEGKAKIVYGPIPPGVPYSDPMLGETPSSTEDAGMILENAGWQKNEEGFREKTIKKTAIKLEFTLTVPDVPFLMKTAERLKAAWEKLGIAVQISELPLEEIADPVIKNREYQMILFGNILNAGSDLHSFWHSSERFYPGLNLSLYNNKEVDKLIEEIRGDFEKETLEKKFYELQQTIVEDYPVVFLYTPDYLYVAGKGLMGLSPRLIIEPADRFQNVAEWHLKTKRVLK